METGGGKRQRSRAQGNARVTTQAHCGHCNCSRCCRSKKAACAWMGIQDILSCDDSKHPPLCACKTRVDTALLTQVVAPICCHGKAESQHDSKNPLFDKMES